MARRRPRRSRLLGLLVLLVLLELALQAIAPLVQRALSREGETADPDAPLTVLCVGDSNTYGLNLPQVYAYPALLEIALDSRYRHPVQVVNRGIPGQNCAQVADGLEADLSEVDADLVILLAGINDTWNTEGQELGLWSWLGHLKLVRLVRVLTAGVTSATTFEISADDQGEFIVDRGDGARRVNLNGESGQGASLTGAPLRRAIETGLRRALARVREHGAVPVLMTYAESSGPFAEVNQVLRELAAAEDVLLVDHGAAFVEHFAEQGYASLMFDDHHPNVRGYKLMARAVAAALEAAGHVPAPRADGGATTRRELPADQPPRLILADDGQLLLHGPADWPFQVLISHPAGADGGFPAGEVRVPLAADEGLLALCRLDPGLSGRLDAAGQARVGLSPTLRAATDGPLDASLLLLNEHFDLGDGPMNAVLAASPALRLP